MSVSIEVELLELLTEYCKEKGVHRSVFVRTALRRALGQTNVMKKKHTSTEQARAMREDGLCNPNPAGGMICQICYGEENNDD